MQSRQNMSFKQASSHARARYSQHHTQADSTSAIRSYHTTVSCRSSSQQSQARFPQPPLSSESCARSTLLDCCSRDPLAPTRVEASMRWHGRRPHPKPPERSNHTTFRSRGYLKAALHQRCRILCRIYGRWIVMHDGGGTGRKV